MGLSSPDDSLQAEKVLAVDDDPVILRATQAALEHGGFDVWTASSGLKALQLLENRGLPHVAVVDIRMPEMDGLELAKRIHEFSDLPIIMLTTVDDSQTIVDALEGFADDYITKPFDPEVLQARVRRVLRRVGDFSYTLAPHIVIDERMVLDLARKCAVIDGQEVNLTPTENKILYLLLRSGGRTVRTDFLLRRVWPLEEVFEDTLRTHVYRLRAKIERDAKKPRYVITVRGEGYRFSPPAASQSAP